MAIPCPLNEKSGTLFVSERGGNHGISQCIQESKFFLTSKMGKTNICTHSVINWKEMQKKNYHQTDIKIQSDIITRF